MTWERVRRPGARGLLQRLGEPEVELAAEILPGAVERARAEQLLTADEPELFAQLGPDQVLPALSPGKGEVRRLGPLAPNQDGQELGVLVVGGRGDHQQPLGVGDATPLRRVGGRWRAR